MSKTDSGGMEFIKMRLKAGLQMTEVWLAAQQQTALVMLFDWNRTVFLQPTATPTCSRHK